MNLKLAEVQVFVTDLERARAFYQDLLGMPLKARSEAWLVFDPGMKFVVMDGATSGKPGGNYGATADTVACLATDHIEETYRELKRQGVRFLGEIKAVPQGKFVPFLDPDGNLFELVETAS